MKRKSFTILELLIVAIILGLLVTVSIAFYAGDYSSQRDCASNLDVIFKGIENYRNATGQYPPDDSLTSLKSALYPTYISQERIFTCPADHTGSQDSYSAFYVKRNNVSNLSDFVLGCARHEHNTRAINLFYQGQILKYNVAQVTAGGGALYPGDETNAAINFQGDGSSINVTAGGPIALIQSFFITSNRCYSLVRTRNNNNRLECIVTPGSKLDVITPTAIVSVGGTEFIVITDNTPATYAAAKTGMVMATEKTGNGTYRVLNCKVVEVTAGSRPIRRKSAELPPNIRNEMNAYLGSINDAED